MTTPWTPVPIGQVQLAPNDRGYMAPTNLGPANTAYTALAVPGYEDTQRFLNRAAAAKNTVPASPKTVVPTWGREVRSPVTVSNPVAAAYSGVATPAVNVDAPAIPAEWVGGGLQMPMSGNTGLGMQLPGPNTSVGFQAPDAYSLYTSPVIDGGISDGVRNMTTEPLSGWDSFKKTWIGTKDNPGWGGFALGAANSLASMYFGMQQYGLAKQTLAENKRQFQLNYDAQKQTTNTALEDRQRARVASNPGAYQSVGEYMDKNGVK